MTRESPTFKRRKPLLLTSITILVILGFIIFSLSQQQPIAVIKLINPDTSTTTYYTIYRNGNKEIVQDDTIIDQLVSRESNQIYAFNRQFSPVNIVITRRLDSSTVYLDVHNNQYMYDQVPVIADTNLADAAEDFFTKTSELHNIDLRIFRDNNTIFVVGLRDLGFGSSCTKFYVYTISTKSMQEIGCILGPDYTSIVDWVYSY